jgi:hypothetical protein
MLTAPHHENGEDEMPTLTPAQAVAKEATDKVLVRLLVLDTPSTQASLGCTRHRLLAMLDAKLIRASGAAKNVARGRKAVTYELTAKGSKRAWRL